MTTEVTTPRAFMVTEVKEEDNSYCYALYDIYSRQESRIHKIKGTTVIEGWKGDDGRIIEVYAKVPKNDYDNFRRDGLFVGGLPTQEYEERTDSDESPITILERIDKYAIAPIDPIYIGDVLLVKQKTIEQRIDDLLTNSLLDAKIDNQ